jgi:hypothetical protein
MGIQRGNKQALEVTLDWYLGLHKTYPRILEKKAKKKRKSVDRVISGADF